MELNVTRQQLLKCVKAMAKAKPWVGQSGKLGRRQVINKPVLLADVTTQEVDLSLPATTYIQQEGKVK